MVFYGTQHFAIIEKRLPETQVPFKKKQFLQWEIQNCYKQSSRDRGFQLSLLSGIKMLKMLVWHQFHWEVFKFSLDPIPDVHVGIWGSASRLWFYVAIQRVV